MTSTVDLETFRRLQSTLVCPFCENTGTISNIPAITKTPKFKCTNTECSSTSITPSQVKSIMSKPPSKKRPPPSSTTGSHSTTPNHTHQEPPTQPTFEPHPSLPTFMTDIIAQLNEVREEQRHSKEQQQLFRLEQEQLKTTNARLAEAIHELQTLRTTIHEKDQLIQRQQQEIDELRNNRSTTDTIPTINDSSASKHAPQGSWEDQTRIQHLHSSLAEGPQSTTMKKQQAAARIFTLPSNNQGFQHIYLPTRARLRISQIRQNLRKLHIDNNRILDINYPAMNTTSLLVHNDFADELVSKLNRAGITPLDSFNPVDPQHLRDPKYTDNSPSERAEIAFNLHQQRMLRSIDFIRATAKYAVAKCFARTGWINNEQLTSILDFTDTNSAASAFIIDTDNNSTQPALDEDMAMDSSNTSNNQPTPDISQ